MIIKLSVKNRVVFPQIFSANKDTLTEAAVQREIKKIISFDEKEAREISLTAVKDGYTWDAIKGKDKDFIFTPEQVLYLRETVFTLSKAHGITQDLLVICEKIQGI